MPLGTLTSTRFSTGGEMCVCVCVCVYVYIYESESCSVVSDSATPWTVAHKAPLSMEFSGQGYWSGLPFPTLGHLPDPGIKPESLASLTLAGRFVTTEPPGKPYGLP